MKRLRIIMAAIVLAAPLLFAVSPAAHDDHELHTAPSDGETSTTLPGDGGLLPSGAVLYGDANGDGAINARDVVVLMKAAVSGDYAGVDAANSDVNFDGTVNAKDVIAIMKYLAGVSTVRLGHKDRLEVVTESSCTEHGQGRLVCSICGDTALVTLPLADHRYVSKVTVGATCTQSGVVTYTCEYCGDSYTETVPAIGHDFADGRCRNCGEAEQTEPPETEEPADVSAHTGPYFTLSKKGTNVVVLFIDRALGEDFPYLLKERPGLKETYDGFTYYSNVISFGGHTNFGAPAVMGGYEYTPVELNKRTTELLVDKHNESMKVMPVLFSEKGYNVTVCDSPYGNYQWYSDLSIFDGYPKIKTYHTTGYFKPKDASGYGEVTQDFVNAYEAIVNLRTMTKISGAKSRNFLFFYNDLPHQVMKFSEPDYLPCSYADNSAYDAAHGDRFTVDGRTLRMGPICLKHYQTNMATMIEIGKWLDYLRENDVYDNTKIIIVADHGYYLHQLPELDYRDHKLPNGENVYIGNYFPLLMVKDFDSHGFSVSSEFMTNADVPSIACEGVIKDPVNPFTGKKIDMSEKTAHPQFIITDHAGWSTKTNNGKAFIPCTWAAVTSNIWDRNDWRFIDDYVVLYDHRMPK